MTDISKMTSGRSGGRAQRLKKRAAKPNINPCPPGQFGGMYKPLSQPDLENIFDTALRLLSELGMGEIPNRLRQDLLTAGAQDSEAGRVVFPRSLTEDAIAKAAKTFVAWA